MRVVGDNIADCHAAYSRASFDAPTTGSPSSFPQLALNGAAGSRVQLLGVEGRMAQIGVEPETRTQRLLPARIRMHAELAALSFVTAWQAV